MNTIRIENRQNYQVISLDRGAANPMNLQMLQELTAAFQAAKADTNIGGVILTGKPGFFSAGLDVVEMFGLDLEQLTHFWMTFKQLVIELVQFPKPFIVAVTGHSPAGGCVMACCADYRVMVSDQQSRIGLNEIPVGITLPENVFHLYAFWLGKRAAYQCLLEGRLMLPHEAAALGLLDELAEADQVLAKAEAKMQQYLRFDPAVWQTSKVNMRRELIQVMQQDYERNARLTAERMFTPQARAFFGKVVERLTQPKK